VVEIRLFLGVMVVLETVHARSPFARAVRTMFELGRAPPSPPAAPARARPAWCCFCCLLDDALASLRCARLLLLGSFWAVWPPWAGGGRKTASMGVCCWPPLGWRAFLLGGSWASGSESAAAACVSCLSWVLRPACLQAWRECDWHSARDLWQETWKELIWLSYLDFPCPVPCAR